jgi:hypothetical protein
MKSAEVSAGAEILSSIYLFFGELLAGTFGCGSLGGVSVSVTPGSSLMILLPGAGSLSEITKTRL